MRPRTAPGWATAFGVVGVALVLVALLAAALARTTSLVDLVPGADAGIATSPALERARADSAVLGAALLGLGVVVGTVLLLRYRHSRPGRSRGESGDARRG